MTSLEEDFMHRAIAEASKCQPENWATPLVGAVAVRGAELLATAYRGERRGEHAEFTLLEGKLAGQELRDVAVYTTLEPCTTRTHPKVPCAERLVERKVARVVLGMLDPDERIRGLGQMQLRKANIATQFFPHDLMNAVEELN